MYPVHVEPDVTALYGSYVGIQPSVYPVYVVLISSTKSANAFFHWVFIAVMSGFIQSLYSHINGTYVDDVVRSVHVAPGVNVSNKVSPNKSTVVVPVYSIPSISITKEYVIPLNLINPLKFSSPPRIVSKSSSIVVSKSGYRLSTNSVGWQGNLYGYFGLPKILFSIKLPPNHNVVAGII